MKLAPYIACICEGSAEAAIIDVLVDNNLLIFTREEMLRLMKNFGYTFEQLRSIVLPMAKTGTEPTAAMGHDTPLAVYWMRRKHLKGYT